MIGNQTLLKVLSEILHGNSFQCENMFTNRFQKWVKHQGLTMNKNSIIGFISNIIQGMFKNSRKVKKKGINRNSGITSQLKLFSMNELQKSGMI